MHVFTVGGNGQIGTLVIDNLISQGKTILLPNYLLKRPSVAACVLTAQPGHTVTALVRNPSAVQARDGVTLVKGTPANFDDVKKAFSTKPDAVVITLAHAKGLTFGDDGKTLFLTHVTNNIVSIVRSVDPSIKIAYLSAFGVGDSFPALNCLMRGLVRVTPLGTQFGDHEGAENALKKASAEEGIVFVAARPAMLNNGRENTVSPLGEKGENAKSFMPSISRASVARFLVDVALNKNRDWDGKTVVIANEC